ncbi:MAG: tetratricopeptide repeat protein [Saprospiraceae bacterium]|nr:tetratricopeptide repeat protein [Saprospiraceae bacterium]
MDTQDFQRLVEAGIDKCRHGKFEDALSLFNDAEKIGLSESLLYNRSKAYFKLRKLDDATQDLNQLIEIQPDNSVWYAERAVIYHYREDKDKALADLDKAADLDPENGFRFASRAFIKDFYGDHQGALEDYEKAIELDPEDAISHNNKGLVEEKLGYKARAKASFSRADKLDPIKKGHFNPNLNSTTNPQPSSRPKDNLNVEKPKTVGKKKSSMTFEHYIDTLGEVTTSKKGAKSFLNFVFGKKDNS